MSFKFNPFTGTLDNVNSRASQINVSQCGVPTYKTVQDWMNTTQASGIISGGGFTSNGDGSLTVAAGQGIIRATNSDIAEACFFDWSENDTISLVDNQTNYIYVDYNSGAAIVGSETTKTANNRTKIFLGKVFREGNNLDLIEAGMVLSEATKRILTYLTTVFGEIKRASGVSVSESGTRNLNITAGVVFAGLTRIATSALDTFITGNFELYYYNGVAWIESDETQIPNSQYNDITTGLVNLTSNRYGVYWVYASATGDVFVLYGQDDYTLANAEAAIPPASLPNHVAQFGFIAAKIIVQEGETNFLSVESAYDTQFSSSGVIIHNETSGLNAGDYKHLTATNYIDLTDSGATTLHKHSHTILDDIGTNTHAQIDTHIGSTSNPHSVSASDVGNGTAQWNANKIQDVTVDDTAKADGYALTYDSASGNIIYAAGGGGGGVSVSGTPLNNQLAVWTNATTIEGDTGLTYDGNRLICEGSGSYTTSIGSAATAVGDYSICIGRAAASAAATNICIGRGAAITTSTYTYCVLMGYNTDATGAAASVFGKNSSAGSNASSFGNGSAAAGESACAFGRVSEASGDYSFGIGYNATAAYAGSGAIGKNSLTTRANQIVIGGASNDDVTIFGGLFIEGRTSAFTDKSGFGQIWIRSSDGAICYTDDTGTNYTLDKTAI
jgi:hypothetical protein